MVCFSNTGAEVQNQCMFLNLQAKQKNLKQKEIMYSRRRYCIAEEENLKKSIKAGYNYTGHVKTLK